MILRRVFLLTIILGACKAQPVKFSSRPLVYADLPAENIALGLVCSPNKTEEKSEKREIHSQMTFQVTGELCEKQEQTVKKKETIAQTILFVLDHSGSMILNDPLEKVGGVTSCGRLDAINAILEKLTAEKAEGVQLGVVGFADAAAQIIDIKGLEEFKKSMNPTDAKKRLTMAEDICQAEGKTNYQDALSAASTALSTSTGKKVLYFISDGLPSVGGRSPKATGLAAAAELKKIPDLDFYAVYLQDESADEIINLESDVTDPIEYLAEMTGNKDRVKSVLNADDLVQAATEIIVTVPPAVEKRTLKARLIAPNGKEESVNVQLAEEAKVNKKGSYAVDPFVVELQEGQHKLEVYFAEDQVVLSRLFIDASLEKYKVSRGLVKADSI